MSRLKIVYILSLVILGVLITFTVFIRPVVMGGEYSEVQQAQLLEREDQWIIELHIFNHEAEETNYTINVLVDEELCTESIRLRPGELFKYIHHISRDKLEERDVSVAVYKEGEATPFEQVTYYLK
jgi:hypothetical protein